MKVREIAAAIEAFAPLGTQESWDNAGLCIGSPDAGVRAVLVGFDCTPALVREAVDRGADMIVTHHPLIFGGLRRIDPDDPVGAAVYLAIRHGIAVYAAHTNADKAVGGVNTLRRLSRKFSASPPAAAPAPLSRSRRSAPVPTPSLRATCRTTISSFPKAG